MIVHLFSLVFQANRLANTVRRYKIIHNFHYIKKFLLNIKFHQGGRPMSAPTACFVFAHKTNGGHWPPLQVIHNLHINKNGRETMFCILQTCYPTTIFHFPFSILHLIKPFARYFKQRFAPFIRHRRRSQGYPYCCNSTSAIALPNRLPE